MSPALNSFQPNLFELHLPLSAAIPRQNILPDLSTLFFFNVIYLLCWAVCKILVPWPGIEPVSPALEAQSLACLGSTVLTTGPPEKFPHTFLKYLCAFYWNEILKFYNDLLLCTSTILSPHLIPTLRGPICPNIMYSWYIQARTQFKITHWTWSCVSYRFAQVEQAHVPWVFFFCFVWGCRFLGETLPVSLLNVLPSW